MTAGGPAADPAESSYRAAGVDIDAGERAVELMKSHVAAAGRPEVLGGLGGFAGMFALDVARYRRPVLAASTDGVGTKTAIAQALGVHDTIGVDLVAMVVDDLVVPGAEPLFLLDYVACGRVVPERIAAIVDGIARGCRAAGCALLGGETAEHPGPLEPDEYDVAGAAVGAVEAAALLGPDRVRAGDVVLALESSGLHANGFSLVRRILADRGIGVRDRLDELGVVGETLLEPTRLYTTPLLEVVDGPDGGAVHALSHVTGGGIAANLARVLPPGAWVEVERCWRPPPVFQVLADLGGLSLESVEGTWNLGVGMLAVVDAESASVIAHALAGSGVPTWQVGVVSADARPDADFTEGAKGAVGGAVRLTGPWQR